MKKCCWLYAHDKLNTYAACFIGKTTAELVDEFNQDVGLTGLTQDRAYYHEALLHAFEERGIDVSAITDGDTISFAQPIRYNREEQRLEINANE